MKRSQWQDNINSYCLLAQYYLSDVPTLIRHVPADELRGDWPEDRSLFPSDDAMLAHRTDTIIMRNFRTQHDRVIDCVSSFCIQATFHEEDLRGLEHHVLWQELGLRLRLSVGSGNFRHS
jgi:hypothetical protein